MKVLLTGASSFTGYWFAHALASAGHELVLTFRRDADVYEGVRRSRVERLADMGRCVYGCVFGEKRFLDLIRGEEGWSLLAHHATEAANYKSPDFDVLAALANNTRDLRSVLATLAEHDCRHVLATGSFFEPGEGAGSEGLPAFSPYGLSKALTAQVLGYYVQQAGMRLGKFVIPNPFGPYEEPRFTQYLVRSWYEHETPIINAPAYVRDNIHVSLLAKAYAAFANELVDSKQDRKLNPSGYIETQGAFARRFASEIGPRLGLDCPLELRPQAEFREPRIRINTDALDHAQLGWNEAAAWDALAEYYRQTYGRRT